MSRARNLNVVSAITWPLIFFAGGVIRWLVDRHLDKSDRTSPR